MRREIKAAIGDALRAKREKLGISQEELAERAGVDRTYISILERGLKKPHVRHSGEDLLCSGHIA